MSDERDEVNRRYAVLDKIHEAFRDAGLDSTLDGDHNGGEVVLVCDGYDVVISTYAFFPSEESDD